MTDNDEPVRSFRAEVPQPGKAAWAAVRGALAQEIAAELEGPRDRGATKRWWSPRLLAVGLAGLVLTGAVAYGAKTLIGIGSPAPNPPVSNPPSNIRLLGLRVADPGGGSPWGIRLALSPPRISARSNVAIQIGRIRDGQMGFIGQDNVFHNDHLFHAAGPNSALITPADYPITGTPQKPDLRSVYHFALSLPGVASAYDGCSTVKVPTHVSQPKHVFEGEVRSLRHQLSILRADGPAAQRAARAFGGSVAALRATLLASLRNAREEASGLVSERSFASCPGSDLRTIVFGFSGPGSTSITISGLGVHETEPLHADDDGFYLFVLSNHWSYGSKFQAIVTCLDGRTINGLAAPGTPDPPYCKAG
ncbi:MAG TPA: hypothetical protein VID48_06130 [Solirubrobacteraceae bacterium]|jgi:hypothetical protein